MKLETLAIEQAVGGVLIHNIADADGHKALNKGHRLTAADIPKLRALGKTDVFVGVYDADDLSEDAAAARVGQAVTGANIAPSDIGTGRINLFAATRGLFEFDANALGAINMLDGITIATIPAHTVVEPKRMVATIKTIGLGVPKATVEQVEALAARTQGILSVRPLNAARVGVILTGSSKAQARVEKTFTPAITGRVEELGSTIVSTQYVAHEAGAIAAAIQQAQAGKVDCILLAGETSIMDLSDVTPSGIVAAGGTIEVYGAPVEPGNLLLLAYLDALPIVGAPGCVKSRDINVVDLILPRVLAGERITKRDVVALANGGLLI